MLASIDDVIALLKRQSRKLEGEIASMIDDDPLWAKLAQSWRSVKRVAGRTIAHPNRSCQCDVAEAFLRRSFRKNGHRRRPLPLPQGERCTECLEAALIPIQLSNSHERRTRVHTLAARDARVVLEPLASRNRGRGERRVPKAPAARQSFCFHNLGLTCTGAENLKLGDRGR